MSMFRTLQNNPGTISLFKSTGKNSESILALLNKTSVAHVHNSQQQQHSSIWNKIIHGRNNREADSDKQLYQIELVPESQLPTFHQLKLIKSFAIEEPLNLQIFKQSFPSFINESDNKFTTEFPVDEQDYFHLIEEKSNKWFQPPLVVDWDNSKLANDISTLKQLLANYD